MNAKGHVFDLYLVRVRDALRGKDGGCDLKGCHWPFSGPEHVHGVPMNGPMLEPSVSLASLHGNASEVISRVKHFDHGLNVPHLVRKFFLLLLVLSDRSAQFGVKPFKRGDGRAGVGILSGSRYMVLSIDLERWPQIT